MTPKKNNEANTTYLIWRGQYEYKNLDSELAPFLNRNSISKRNNWIKTARCALQLSINIVAKCLGISKQAYANLESSERVGTIKMDSLMRVAEALDCELVYVLKPKNGLSFSQIIWEKLSERAIRHPGANRRPPPFKSRAIAAVARELRKEPEFRRKQGWSKRK